MRAFLFTRVIMCRRCNLAAEYYAQSAFRLRSRPLLLLVDESAKRLRTLTERYAAWGAHGINTHAALPHNRSSVLPWGVTVAELMAQEMAPGCRAMKHHPGWRYHRFVAAAVARHHLLQLRKALQARRSTPQSWPFSLHLDC